MMERKVPLVSVITPCFNGEKYLNRYFDSILSQTYPNIEVIFVNDGSQDRTGQIALSYQNRLEEKGISFHYIYQENKGQAAAVNQGLALFTGDYLTWPDSDDSFSCDYFEKLVRYLEEHPKAGIVQGRVVYVYEDDPEKEPVLKEIKDKTSNKFLDYINERDVLFGGFMARTTFFLEALPSRKIYESRAGQNWQLILPCCYRHDFGYAEDIYYYYHIHQDSHSNQEKDYPSILQKTYNHEDMLKHSICVLDMPEGEREDLFRQIEIRYIRKRMTLARKYHEKDDIRKQYNLLKQMVSPEKKDRRKYYREIDPVYDFIFTTLGKMKRAIQKTRKKR